MVRQYQTRTFGAAAAATLLLLSTTHVLASPSSRRSSLHKRDGVTVDGPNLAQFNTDLPLPAYDTSQTNFQCQSDPLVAPSKDDFHSVIDVLKKIGTDTKFKSGDGVITGCDVIKLPPTGMARTSLCNVGKPGVEYTYSDVIAAIQKLETDPACGVHDNVGGITPVTAGDFPDGNYILVDKNNAPPPPAPHHDMQDLR